MSRFAALWLFFPCALTAQTPASVERAASSLRADDIRRRIGLLADDSMRGRSTPSPELEKAASWIAAEFRRFGLRPGGDSGTYLQRYPIVRKALDTAETFLTVSRSGHGSVALRAGNDVSVLHVGPHFPSQDVSGPVVLLAGSGSVADSLTSADVAGAWLVEIGTAGRGGLVIDLPSARQALAAGAVGLLLISDRPDAEWRARLDDAARPTLAVGMWPQDSGLVPAAAEIRDATAAQQLGLDAAALRAQRTRSLRRLSGLTLALHVRERVVETTTAPNVIATLEGSDPRLRSEYVLFTAHMDHIGVASPGNPACRARGADSICNGADDDASGTTAVIELAQAFAQLTPHPKRSLVFMTVSGEERGLWGSEYFTDHPTVPLHAVVADLNSDMVGRNWKDTIAVIGKEQSDLGATVDRVARAHPELSMTPIGDIWPLEHFYTRSDHYNFARRGIPILFFFNGTHPDYHQVSDEVSKIDGEKESRIVKLLFYVGLEIAGAPRRPRWDPESYRRVVDSGN